MRKMPVTLGTNPRARQSRIVVGRILPFFPKTSWHGLPSGK
jgi:hypothetical protein